MKVVALLTCHNRKPLTLRCLGAFFTQTFSASPPVLEAIVVDDGSTDGTGDALRGEFSSVRVVEGDGSLFWARGMHLAERHALTDSPEYLLWLNDDVALNPTALDALLTVSRAAPDAIVVGALSDPDSGTVTYSGVTLSWWHPLRVRRVEPGRQPVEADTFNGNVVLVPRVVFEAVGPIDGGFAHGQADFDYGLRARDAGFRIMVAPDVVGTCRRGGQRGTFADTTLSLAQRWRLIQGATGLPMRSHARYLRRHGGPLWPLFWAAPYVKLTASALVSAPKRRRSSM